MAVNGLANGSADPHQIVFGLMNQQGKYLTAEKFGNQISVTGTSLRAKQLWTFEPEGEGSTKGYLQSPQKNYLETTKTGTVSCKTDEKQPSLLFDVSISEDGRWAFKDSFGKFLAGNTERLYTTMDSKQADEYLWAIHIAAHPQCNLKSISRKRYVHLKEDEFTAEEDIPWGHDAVITVEFQKGKYALRDSRGRYLNGVSGKLEESAGKDSMFVLSLQGSEFAFRASNGKYLTVHGPKKQLIASKQNPDNDTLFSLEESKAQVTLTANNGKKASIRQGIDVTANQFMEPEDSETFQVGYVNGDDVTFVAKNKKYWSAGPKSITASSDNVTSECTFKMEWKDAKIAIKANNGKYITSTTGGQLSPTGDDSSDENALFILELVNRQILVLRCDHGYIGVTQIGGNDKIQCNRGTYDAIQVENESGKYRLKMANDKSWKVDDTGALTISSGEGDSFLFVLCGKNKMKIQTVSGKYLKGDHNGAITATGEDGDKAITWEY